MRLGLGNALLISSSALTISSPWLNVDASQMLPHTHSISRPSSAKHLFASVSCAMAALTSSSCRASRLRQLQTPVFVL